MDFFNKYKQLFQVRDAAPPLSTPLTLNHQLFIDQPYRPAYSEEIKLSSKLMEMRKGADDLEDKIDQIMNTIKINKRESTPAKEEKGRVTSSRPISTKLSNIFNTEENQLVKQSELEHVFGYRMKQAKRPHVDEPSPKLISPIKENGPAVRLPKLEPLKKFQQYPVNNNIFHSTEQEEPYRPAQIRQQRTLLDQTSYKQAKPTKVSYKEAQTHRKESARRLQDRRQKLRTLLKAR